MFDNRSRPMPNCASMSDSLDALLSLVVEHASSDLTDAVLSAALEGTVAGWEARAMDSACAFYPADALVLKGACVVAAPLVDWASSPLSSVAGTDT
jgi:hypothetical protein